MQWCLLAAGAAQHRVGCSAITGQGLQGQYPTRSWSKIRSWLQTLTGPGEQQCSILKGEVLRIPAARCSLGALPQLQNDDGVMIGGHQLPVCMHWPQHSTQHTAQRGAQQTRNGLLICIDITQQHHSVNHTFDFAQVTWVSWKSGSSSWQCGWSSIHQSEWPTACLPLPRC